MASASPLTTAPINRTLLFFALPTLLSSMLQSANGSINAIWIGRLLGNGALAATTNGNLVMFLLTSFVFGFGLSSTILIGQAIGRGNIHEARTIVGSALGSFVPLAMLIAVGGWFFAPTVLSLLGTPAEIVPLAIAFLRVTFLAMPAILMLTMIMMALRGSGDAITPLIFMGVAVVLDIALNPFFILGIGPFPEMGIAGSAMAMAVSNFIALLGMITYVYARDLPLRLRGDELRSLIPDRKIVSMLVRKGLPMGIQMIVVSSSMLTMMSMVNAQGVNTAAAFGATQQIWTYVQMPAMALGAAVSTMAAQNIGAGRWDRVGQITRSGIVFNLILTGGMVAILTMIDRQAIAMFLGPDSPAIPIGEHIGRLSTWGFIAFGVSMVIFGTVRANGQVIWPVIILFVSLYPVRLGFAHGLHGFFGPDALWYSFPAAMVATMLMAIGLYLHGGWRKAPPLILDEPQKIEVACEATLTSEAAPPGSATAPQPAYANRGKQTAAISATNPT